jgi:hypothetical protein
MRNPFLIIIILFSALNSYGQNSGIHYIKFLHVGEKILPVHTLNISYQDGEVPKDKDEILLDTMAVRSIMTNEESFKNMLNYINKTTFQLGRSPGILSFGTFKIIVDGKYYYLPGLSCTAYFKNLVSVLKKKKSDPKAIQGIVDNYPCVFNP